MAPKTYLGAWLPCSPALTISALATLSGKRQVRISDAQRPPQHDDEQDADQAAHHQNHGGLPVVLPEVGPQMHTVNLHHHECRNGEDRRRHQRLSHRCRRARDVLFEYRPAKIRQPEQRNGDDRGGNGGSGDGLAGLHAEISIRRAEDQRQHQADQYSLHSHFRRRTFSGGCAAGINEHGRTGICSCPTSAPAAVKRAEKCYFGWAHRSPGLATVHHADPGIRLDL